MSSKYEREFKKFLEAKGWIVFRSAGSRSVDLIGIDLNFHLFLIEVKSFYGDTFRVTKTKDDKEQWEQMCELQNRLMSGKAVGPPFLDTCGGVDYFHVLYALRRKGQGVDWRIVLPSDLHKPFHWRDSDYDLDKWLGW